MSHRKLIINAVASRAGGGLNDLVHTLPLLERELGSRGWSVSTYVVPVGAEALTRAGASLANVRTVSIDSPVHRAMWEMRRLPAIVRKEKPAIVFQFSNLIFREMGVPQITVLRSQTFFSPDYAGQSRRGMYQKLRFSIGQYRSRKTIERAAAVFCISQTQKDDIRRAHGILADRVEVAHLGVCTPERVLRGNLHDQAGTLDSLPSEACVALSKVIRPGSRVLLNISHYYQQKNLLTLLEAVDQMSHVDPKIRLILTAGVVNYSGPVGDCERREMQLARDLTRRGILADLGPVHKDCVWPLLQRADVFVFPSSLESFGHPLLEAMAVGTPVVASDTPIHREIAGSAAVFHDVYDSASLASAVRRVLDDPMLRSHLITEGEKTIARFSWNAHVQKLVDAIGRVASEPAAEAMFAESRA